jgi:hypothetical protein
MAQHTLSQLRALVRSRIAASDTDTALTAHVLNGLVNSALRQVSVDHSWPWLLTSETLNTVAGTATVTAGSNWLETESLSDVDGVIFRHTSRKDLLSIPVSNTGRPSLYAVSNGTILLRVVPDGAYALTHWYYRMEPELISDQATPLIPVGYDDGVIEFASYLSLRHKREDARAQVAKKAYDEWLKRTSDNTLGTKDTKAPRIYGAGAIL